MFKQVSFPTLASSTPTVVHPVSYPSYKEPTNENDRINWFWIVGLLTIFGLWFWLVNRRKEQESNVPSENFSPNTEKLLATKTPENLKNSFQ
ncbi:hypothetical protein BWI97_02650 [Siphonobacter sp. BAB-5405]|uniref:hypothetical protein n=1 Tax=Siphonobacter sp. BAB-5405 TaxID=1864825 RepID=UPI000C8009D3|nr:hypothetical protein [Siphonobacter sp. BAB-5405]PMD99315.1 hypothetical protein BWI97_02650 [Siphonobacter sp. BAB-5405]